EVIVAQLEQILLGADDRDFGGVGANAFSEDPIHLVIGDLEVDPLISRSLIGDVPIPILGAVPLVRPAHDMEVVLRLLVPPPLCVLRLAGGLEDVLLHLMERPLPRNEAVHQASPPLPGDLLVPEEGLNPVSGDPAL